MNKRTEYILVSLNLLNNKLRNLATKFWENRRRKKKGGRNEKKIK